jgi:hypothetical protein
LPTSNDVALLVEVSEDDHLDPRTLSFFPKGGEPHEIKDTNPFTDPMTYICLFPHGDNGWRPDLMDQNGNVISASQFYSHRLMVRTDENNEIVPNPIHLGGRLFQQYLVDQCAKVEYQRLKYYFYISFFLFCFFKSFSFSFGKQKIIFTALSDDCL